MNIERIVNVKEGLRVPHDSIMKRVFFIVYCIVYVFIIRAFNSSPDGLLFGGVDPVEHMLRHLVLGGGVEDF